MGDGQLLLLTTTGRKTGKVSTTPLMFIPWGDRETVIVASLRGAPNNPAWYYNITASPDAVQVQVMDEQRVLQVRVLEGEERERPWAQLPSVFDDYQNKTTRQIPLIALSSQT